MSLSVRILGCGSSGGVPRVGTGWGACDPANPKNRRTRCSILVENISASGARTIVLIDTGPDLREQLLAAQTDHIDAVLYTHAHADHTHGIDDVRPLVLKMKAMIPAYMDAPTSLDVRDKFSYIFETPPGSYYPPLLVEHRLEHGKPIHITGPGGALSFTPVNLHHGEIDALGFRFGNAMYSPDVKAIPADSLPYFHDLDLWIVDALRHTPHPSHFCLSETLAWIDRLKPKRAILTNLHTDLDYQALRQSLPDHIVPAFDGMQIDI